MHDDDGDLYILGNACVQIVRQTGRQRLQLASSDEKDRERERTTLGLLNHNTIQQWSCDGKRVFDGRRERQY